MTMIDPEHGLFVPLQQEEEARSPEMKEMLDEVGFTYYLIIARLHDLDPKLHKLEGKSQPHYSQTT